MTDIKEIKKAESQALQAIEKSKKDAEEIISGSSFDISMICIKPFS